MASSYSVNSALQVSSLKCCSNRDWACQIQDLQYGWKMSDTRLAIWLKNSRYKSCNMKNHVEVRIWNHYRHPVYETAMADSEWQKVMAFCYCLIFDSESATLCMIQIIFWRKIPNSNACNFAHQIKISSFVFALKFTKLKMTLNWNGSLDECNMTLIICS